MPQFKGATTSVRLPTELAVIVSHHATMTLGATRNLVDLTAVALLANPFELNHSRPPDHTTSVRID